MLIPSIIKINPRLSNTAVIDTAHSAYSNTPIVKRQSLIFIMDQGELSRIVHHTINKLYGQQSLPQLIYQGLEHNRYKSWQVIQDIH
jgi:hypothetical protein